jgi:hypothetical protein
MLLPHSHYHHIIVTLSLSPLCCPLIAISSSSKNNPHLFVISLSLLPSHHQLLTHSLSQPPLFCLPSHHRLTHSLSQPPLFSHCHLIIVQFLSLPPLCHCCLTLFVISLLFAISSVTHSAHHHVTAVSLHFVTNDVYYFSFNRMPGSGDASSQWTMGMLSRGKWHGKALIAIVVGGVRGGNSALTPSLF